MDSAQAILIVPGYRASRDLQASLVHLDGCWEQVQALELELELELDLGLELELELVAEEAGTGCLASKADRAALQLELELQLWLAQEVVL